MPGIGTYESPPEEEATNAIREEGKEWAEKREREKEEEKERREERQQQRECAA